jgi:hypothetical protein
MVCGETGWNVKEVGVMRVTFSKSRPIKMTTMAESVKKMNLREYYAGLAMQGLLASGSLQTLADLSVEAVKRADALIDALNKTVYEKEME